MAIVLVVFGVHQNGGKIFSCSLTDSDLLGHSFKPQPLPHGDICFQFFNPQLAAFNFKLSLFSQGKAIVDILFLEAGKTRLLSLFHPPKEMVEGAVQIVNGVAGHPAGYLAIPGKLRPDNFYRVLVGRRLAPLIVRLREVLQ
ncbi:hypothetical protein [Nitrosococcus watsonii]|uniref:hypothetical protein n=1 Tax=Nitrosococcus watsonii TaxID=473531 RepID=UPI0012FCA5D0|nr:hypothetical protein [Nitrosococcus watsonii]